MRNLVGTGSGKYFLAIVVVWAIGAVVLLTITVSSTDGILDDTDVIVTQVSEIDRDTEAVALAKRTDRIVEKLLPRVRPLDDRLRVVVGETASIDRSARSILSSARSINATVRSINGHVVDINTDVAAINSTVSSILATARSIRSHVFAIEANAHAIRANAASTAADTSRIEARVRAILATARSIDPGVARININARAVIEEVAAVTVDTGNVIEQVVRHGDAFPREANLQGHAHMIDCEVHRVLLRPRPAYC